MTIQLRNVTAGYVAGAPILNDVSLEVEDRSIVTILGPNGSGKSTLLKVIMGYVPLWTGEIGVDGTALGKAPVHERAVQHGLAYVPQLDNVFGPLTVQENLELGGARLSRNERNERIRELFDLYPQLGDRKRQRADTQSGGERQILAIARALMTRPRFLLLDELSAGLSPLLLERLFQMLADLRDRDDVTILIVEQNAVQSLAVSDRGLVLVLGRAALQGPASDLMDDRRVSELYLGGHVDETYTRTAPAPRLE